VVFLTVDFFAGVVVRFFVVVVARFRVEVSDVAGFRVVAAGRFAGGLATAVLTGESGSGGSPRTCLIALLC